MKEEITRLINAAKERMQLSDDQADRIAGGVSWQTENTLETMFEQDGCNLDYVLGVIYDVFYTYPDVHTMVFCNDSYQTVVDEAKDAYDRLQKTGSCY